MRIIVRIAIIAFMISLMAQLPASADDKLPKIGIGISVNQDISSFLPRLWINDRLSVNPEIAFSVESRHDSGDELIRVIPGLSVLMHLRPGSDCRPYFGWEFALDILNANDIPYTDIITGPVFGGEYFFSKHFSVSGEYQIEFVFTDEKYSPGFSLSTHSRYIRSEQRFIAHIYF